LRESGERVYVLHPGGSDSIGRSAMSTSSARSVPSRSGTEFISHTSSTPRARQARTRDSSLARLSPTMLPRLSGSALPVGQLNKRS
jgi:hypothetical protein